MDKLKNLIPKNLNVKAKQAIETLKKLDMKQKIIIMVIVVLILGFFISKVTKNPDDVIDIGNNIDVGKSMTIGDNIDVGGDVDVGKSITIGDNANVGKIMTIGDNANVGKIMTIGGAGKPGVLTLYPEVTANKNVTSINLVPTEPNKYGFGIRSGTLAVYTGQHFRLYNSGADKTDGDYIFNFDTANKNAIINSNTTINGTIDLSGDVVYRGNSWSAGYLAHKYSGGNSVFAIYSNRPMLGDGVSMGYNAWVENDEWIYFNGSPFSRMHLGYGFIQMSFGINSEPGPPVFTANGYGVSIAPSLTITGLTSVGATLPAGYKYLVKRDSDGKVFIVG